MFIMKIFLSFYLILLIQTNAQNKMEYNKLTPEEEKVILHKGTEAPYSGEYWNYTGNGTYVCKQCNAPLYKSTSKFDSHCGWPSFDDELDGAVKRMPDADGRRTEIICANCGGHLGHVFLGERFTEKNTRHCVNSLSIDFIPAPENPQYLKAYFAGGCFWGVEYHFEKIDGVISAKSGYMGGGKDDPSYQEVCTGNTGHAEVVEITYDPQKVDFEKLAILFFEIHDPTQLDGQGPDIGEQYRSEIFYTDENQKKVSEKLIKLLIGKGYDVVTGLSKADKFWVAEEYHQDYYERKGSKPYCHFYKKKF